MSNLSEGWSGRMLTQVKFAWTDENELHINIRATSTKPMPADITTHCLFNLAGHVSFLGVEVTCASTIVHDYNVATRTSGHRA